MKKQKIIIMLLIIAMALCILMPKSNAALQSNGGTAVLTGQDTWIVNIRKMEALGGTLGLTETINSDLKSSSGSNNLDIHMEKNTEYGAIAILSASSYGNPNTIADGETTTGNETGIVMRTITTYAEYVAASSGTTFSGKNVKYYNKYIWASGVWTNEIKKGDAYRETYNWHGASYSISREGGSGNTSSCARGYSNSIFGARFNDINYNYPSRAIMICGEGI